MGVRDRWRLVRRLVCEGSSRTFEQEGEPTPVEIGLGVAAMTPENWAVDEQTVMQVATAWSLDPTTCTWSSPAGVRAMVQSRMLRQLARVDPWLHGG